MKGGNLGTDRHPGRRPCDNEGRDWDDVAEAKERQRQPANHQNLEERPGTDPSS